MVHVFKNVGERSSTKNYCPASLISVVSKVFQKLVNNRIVDHQENVAFFISSMVLGLDQLQVFWQLYLIELLGFLTGRATWAVVLDISKAFDRVWYTGLHHKLTSYGVSGQIFGLISCFLSNRRLQVVLQGMTPPDIRWGWKILKFYISGSGVFWNFWGTLSSRGECVSPRGDLVLFGQ